MSNVDFFVLKMSKTMYVDVGAATCRPPRFAYNLYGQPEPPPDMSFRANAVSRGIFPSGKFYLVVVLCPTWWIPPLR